MLAAYLHLARDTGLLQMPTVLNLEALGLKKTCLPSWIPPTFSDLAVEITMRKGPHQRPPESNLEVGGPRCTLRAGASPQQR